MLRDLRWAVRSLRTSPGFTATAMLTLALGIGATTAMYSVVYAAMLRPLPYPDPDRIVSVLLEDNNGGSSSACYALGAALVSGAVLESFAPTVYDDGHLLGTDVARLLSASASPTGTRRNSISLHVLIGIEVALTIVLLAGASTMALSLYRVTRVETGLGTIRFVIATLEPSLRYRDAALRTALFEEAAEQVRAVPGVRAATITSRRPVRIGMTIPSRLHGVQSDSSGIIDVRFRSVQPNYFDVLGIPIVRGRPFDRRDRAGAHQVAIINESTARLFQDGVDPIGRRISTSFDGQPVDLEVVGVASDVRESLSRPPRPESFVPLAQQAPERATLLIFTDMSAAKCETSIKAAVWRMDPTLPVIEVKDFEMVLYEQSAWMRFRAVLLGGFSVSGLLLAVVGVWAVVGFSVVRRTREIGIRAALGAHPRQVLGLMVRQVMTPVAIGAIVGLVGTVNLARFLQAWSFQVQATDPGVLGAVVGLLALAAFCAAAIPARRATRIDPAVTLRAE